MSKAIMKGFQVLIVAHEMLSYYRWIYCTVVHLLCEMPLAVFDFANIFIFSLVEHLVLLFFGGKNYLFGLWIYNCTKLILGYHKYFKDP